MLYLVLWLVSFVVISIVDAIWHLLLFGSIYSADIKKVAPLADGKIDINATPGILSQVLVVSAVVILVVIGLRANQNTQTIALVGAVAGILAISVYGLVNYAIIKDWSFRMTVLEVIWGPILGASAALFVAWLHKALNL